MEFTYDRKAKHYPKLGAYESLLLEQLSLDATKPPRQLMTAVIMFEELQRKGYGYDSVRRYVQRWRRSVESRHGVAYIRQSFAPGEAFQFDWSYGIAEVGGELVKLRIAHFRLCYSRMTFCVTYMRESLEMVIDAPTQQAVGLSSSIPVTRLKQMVNALEVPVVMFLEQGFGVSYKSEKSVNNFLKDDEIRFLHLFRDITNMRLQKRIVNILAQFIKMTEKL